MGCCISQRSDYRSNQLKTLFCTILSGILHFWGNDLKCHGKVKGMYKDVISLKDGRFASSTQLGDIHIFSGLQKDILLKNHEGTNITTLYQLKSGDIAAGHSDKTIRIWSLVHRKCTIKSQNFNMPILSIKEGEHILFCDRNRVSMWDQRKDEHKQLIVPKDISDTKISDFHICNNSENIILLLHLSEYPIMIYNISSNKIIKKCLLPNKLIGSFDCGCSIMGGDKLLIGGNTRPKNSKVGFGTTAIFDSLTGEFSSLRSLDVSCAPNDTIDGLAMITPTHAVILHIEFGIIIIDIQTGNQIKRLKDMTYSFKIAASATPQPLMLPNHLKLQK